MSKIPEPGVRICVPTYNSAATLGATLDSILAQTYGNISVLVVDNASADGSAAIADGYAARDARVRVLRHAENTGAEGNFNRCLRLAADDYTAIYHSDDIYSPSMVAEEVAVLEKYPAAGAVFTMAEGIDAQGAAVRTYALPPGLKPGPDGLYRYAEIFRSVLEYGNYFFCPSVLARTSVYRDTVKEWNAKAYGTSADLDVWLRIVKEFPIAIIDKPLLKYRLSPDSFSYNAARSRTSSPDIFIVLDEYVKNAPPGTLARADLVNYALQRLREDINRSFKLLLKGDRAQSRPLLAGLFRLENIFRSLKSLYHLKLLAYGFTVLLLHYLPLTEALKERLFRLRFGNRAGEAGGR